MSPSRRWTTRTCARPSATPSTTTTSSRCWAAMASWCRGLSPSVSWAIPGTIRSRRMWTRPRNCWPRRAWPKAPRSTSWCPPGTATGGIEWSIIAAKIQSDLEAVGLKINIQQLQQSELLNIYRAQDGQMVLMNWSPDFPDPDGNATPFANFDAKSLAWRNEWNDPKAIEMSKAAAIELDPAKRAQTVRRTWSITSSITARMSCSIQPTRVVWRSQQRQGLHL